MNNAYINNYYYYYEGFTTLRIKVIEVTDGEQDMNLC